MTGRLREKGEHVMLLTEVRKAIEAFEGEASNIKGMELRGCDVDKDNDGSITIYLRLEKVDPPPEVSL
jgi:hypothetical protein